ncbi:MAG: sensor histidine kinase [Nocardioides sp.]
MPNRQLFRITVGSRLFALLALSAPVLWYRDQESVLAVAALGAVWLAAILAELQPRLDGIVPTVEACLVGALCGISVTSAPVVLLALALPPFIAATLHGLRSSLVALSGQLAFVVAAALITRGGDLTPDEVLSIFTWCMAGVGLAMIGSFLHATVRSVPDELTPYLDAQRLIRQLLTISNDLRSGLDVATLAGTVLSDVGDAVPTSGLAIYAPRGDVLVPLVARSTGPDVDFDPAEEIALESWTRSEPLVYDTAFALPLGTSAVVGGRLSDGADLDLPSIERAIIDLIDALRPKAVQLDTALLFADFRDAASADVRTRLAREMHDGVAQDIASLGYLVDALAAKPADEKQKAQLTMLRERITKVVAEVRQSVLTLRTSIGEAQSLGDAISTVARHLSESSRIPITVTLDEHSTRLRPEVEAELFRIAQEAMNNAIKHAQCTTIEVACRVHAPGATISIADDGRGLQSARSDSHGLKIMRERARLVGGTLTIEDRPTGGTLVHVVISDTQQPSTATAEPESVTS